MQLSDHDDHLISNFILSAANQHLHHTSTETTWSPAGCGLKMAQHLKCDFSVTPENFCAKLCTFV